MPSTTPNSDHLTMIPRQVLHTSATESFWLGKLNIVNELLTMEKFNWRINLLNKITSTVTIAQSGVGFPSIGTNNALNIRALAIQIINVGAAFIKAHSFQSRDLKYSGLSKYLTYRSPSTDSQLTSCRKKSLEFSWALGNWVSLRDATPRFVYVISMWR